MNNISYIIIILGFVITTTIAYISGSAIIAGLTSSFLISFLLYYSFYNKVKVKNETRESYLEELSQHLKSTASYSAHLSNVISGINHEVSPWIGGIQNIISRLKNQEIISHDFLNKKLNTIGKACDQTRTLLDLLSTNIKKLNQYNTNETNLLETIESWVNITLMDRFVKDLVDINNFNVDKNSLDWDVVHSPMLLAQVILNLVKNSIEHNPNNLDNIEINFSGNIERKEFIYEDNGCGIPSHMIKNIFKAGITTKQNKLNMDLV